jgi:hypothetical protein
MAYLFFVNSAFVLAFGKMLQGTTASLPIVVLIGALLGALNGVGIFFEPKEPYKWQILCAATLKGVLIALLTAFSIAPGSHWWFAMAVGAFYGFLFGLVIYLAKGGPGSGDAPYVIPGSIITGGLTGLLILMWAMKAI